MNDRPVIDLDGRPIHLSAPVSLMADVAQAMRHAAREAILPRFRMLATEDISEKTPGEVVTAADRDAERQLRFSLAELMPDAAFIGEELVSEFPDAMRAIGDDTVWIVDPLDGTANFAKGGADFAVMVALLKRGEIVASWILDPVSDVLYAAEAGSGAFRNDQRLVCANDVPDLANLHGPVLRQFLPAPVRTHIDAQCHRFGAFLPGSGSAGVDYPRLVEGQHHFILYWRTLAWDHAPGALFAREAGGCVARPDGSPYRVGDDRSGLLIAQNKAVCDLVQDALFKDAP